MMLQFRPDWREIWTAKQAETELRIKFKGPGWYFTRTGDTMLAIPTNRAREETWKLIGRDEELFEFNVWNNSEVVDSFNAIVNAPVRADLR